VTVNKHAKVRAGMLDKRNVLTRLHNDANIVYQHDLHQYQAVEIVEAFLLNLKVVDTKIESIKLVNK
jgi:hypothetical protein